jgi:hypothetical protein
VTDLHNDLTMSEFEIALMDALKAICEVLVAKEISPPAVLAEMLRRQRSIYEQEPQMPGAIFVMDSLVEFLVDPARAEARRLANDPPYGSA